MITRKQYLHGHPSTSYQMHRDYYAQFVTDATIAAIAMTFGVDRLTKTLAKDRHVNTIPLVQWDHASWHLTTPSPESEIRRGSSRAFVSHLAMDRDAVKASGDIVTRAFLVCVAKEAAKQVIERAALAIPASPRKERHHV